MRQRLWQRHVPKPSRAVVAAMVVALAGLATLALSQAAEDPQAELDDGPTAKIMVEYQKGTDIPKLEDTLDELPTRETDDLKTMRVKVLEVPASKRDEIVQELDNDPQVKNVAPDTKVFLSSIPNDLNYDQQWVWPNIQMEPVWDKTTGSANTIVAVIDSGLNTSHIELAGKFVPGYNTITDTTDTNDTLYHGTAVSGLIAANTNNGLGMAGGCWGCKIMPLKAFDDKSGVLSDIIEAFEKALNSNAKVINLSLTTSVNSPLLQSAVDNATAKGIVVVAAAGNDGSNTPAYPAAGNNVISVASTEEDNSIRLDSNYGSWVDIAAPGTDMYTAGVPGNTMVAASGTSFASPVVASLAALMKDRYPQATPAIIADAIATTGEACCTGEVANGRLNASKAMAKLEARYSASKVGDINGDGVVNLSDLSALLSVWNTNNVTADLSKNGKVDLADLSLLLAQWNK